MAPKLEPRRHELVAIIGAEESDGAWNPAVAEAAKAVGVIVGRLGHGIVTNGLDGVAASASEGCDGGGGLTMGILPGDDEVDGNAFLDLVIPTGMGEEPSDAIILHTCKGLIMFPGGSRISSLGWRAHELGRPILSIGNDSGGDMERVASTPLHDLAMVEHWIKALFE